MSLLRRTVVASTIVVSLACLAWASWGSTSYQLAGRYHLHNRVNRFFERAKEATDAPGVRVRPKSESPAPAPAPVKSPDPEPKAPTA